MIQAAITRIWRMEYCFDMLQVLVNANPDTFRENAAGKAMLECLTNYYEGGQWMQDYELDEKGLLPENLKRGVLSQDAVYDFLEQIRNLDRQNME